MEGKFHAEERKGSKEARSHEAWDPDWIEYVYSGILQCGNGNCGEFVANSGTGGVDIDVEIDESGEPEQTWADFFRPKYFEPPLRLIDIPKECPDSVSSPLQESFRLFFSSPAAASNNVRVALEALLTELGVKRFNTRSGRRIFLNLHSRISLLPPKHSDLGELLLAIKWLGNAGSHADSIVTIDDVMDAYELIDHVLQELYMQKAKKAKALAKMINKKKGPKG
ncbi:DUF4145 domain-containing protein [Xanthomonas sp. NCPPB 2654]|uniref:DUF4145 domain-containing protein n=1 Tax=unclassified Xanthomonas TaxID=2643310 RepID=UPI0021E06384|nr:MULTISPECIES: DUF4145 domain-containing protein [unclassified Xanthomonas]MDL5366091.1 DUF4145 domain-containing protein [Xanthomonas sp. NCPPB 2654]UYC20788.1 DUF4145 domain-containing protein [Xanthomonas sp. CFBP 8443]